MIISCSRRTDIPALYSQWFANRIEAGYCTVVNPLNPKQVSRISLRRGDVDAIVFWTKNPKPLIPHLKLLNERGIPYYFQFTITGYGEKIEKHVPGIHDLLHTFKELSGLIGPERVVWRYDPIILSEKLSPTHHVELYSRIADELKGYAVRSVVSVVDMTRRTKANLGPAKDKLVASSNEPLLHLLMRQISEIASSNCLSLYTCAENFDFSTDGIPHGKCIDGDLIERLFGGKVSKQKDPSQRIECGCVKSRDIGFYDSCTHGCVYCYATDHRKLTESVAMHDPLSPSLLGWHEVALKGDEQQSLPGIDSD